MLAVNQLNCVPSYSIIFNVACRSGYPRYYKKVSIWCYLRQLGGRQSALLAAHFGAAHGP